MEKEIFLEYGLTPEVGIAMAQYWRTKGMMVTKVHSTLKVFETENVIPPAVRVRLEKMFGEGLTLPLILPALEGVFEGKQYKFDDVAGVPTLAPYKLSKQADLRATTALFGQDEILAQIEREARVTLDTAMPSLGSGQKPVRNEVDSKVNLGISSMGGRSGVDTDNDDDISM